MTWFRSLLIFLAIRLRGELVYHRLYRQDSLPLGVRKRYSLFSPVVLLKGAAQFGDRSTYQMDSANALEAVREAEADLLEGADMLMVKPAHTYLDILYRIKSAYPSTPLCAYLIQVESLA